MDAPPRTSNPLPLKRHPSIDITLTLSPITPVDYMFETPSPSPPPPPPPPPPPMMGHPIFFNMLDYHGAHCLWFTPNPNFGFNKGNKHDFNCMILEHKKASNRLELSDKDTNVIVVTSTLSSNKSNSTVGEGFGTEVTGSNTSCANNQIYAAITSIRFCYQANKENNSNWEAEEMMNSKIKANMRGSQGHVGTVPMSFDIQDDGTRAPISLQLKQHALINQKKKFCAR
ncbi:hypothetical protein Tco_0252815 [Tanacetum coccineum]